MPDRSEDNMIVCRDLVFEYRSDQSAIRALDGVSFNVRKGEFVAIVGKNGSGKTTLAKCLNALFLPVSGSVTVNGWKTDDEEHLWDIRQSCGMVFQNPDNQLVSSIVEDDVAFGPENMGLPSELIQTRVRDALEAVGMSDYARRAPHTLSGGQKQRIAIAGVLAMKPRCIVFDEPTAMLDPKGRSEVMNIIDTLRKEDIAIILITHFMDEAVKADRVLVMEAGRIVKEGDPQQIFNDEEIAASFGMDLPCGVIMAEKLREGGMDIPYDIVTEAELADYLAGLEGGSKSGADIAGLEDSSRTDGRTGAEPAVPENSRDGQTGSDQQTER